ncbi:MAG: hypothetical protein AAF481_08865 [Acidobacteriota bacterium]
MTRSHRLTTALFISLALLAVPAFAASPVIEAGPDLWRTTDDGSTRADFALEPIPADFFCSGSEPFNGVIGFKGHPLATEPAGILGNTDTIVYRMDDAVFDGEGRAHTRVQVIAMEFDSIAPLKNDCGTFDVRTVLEGEQPVTDMEIRRLRKAGGVFLAEIAVRVRLIFTPRDGKGQLELLRDLRFAPAPNAQWTEEAGKDAVAPRNFFRVDTDADGVADTWVPGMSNFAAGWESGMNGVPAVAPPDCHCDYFECGHRHCLQTADPVDEPVGPVNPTDPRSPVEDGPGVPIEPIQ